MLFSEVKQIRYNLDIIYSEDWILFGYIGRLHHLLALIRNWTEL